ncbi:hypothetical protein [Mucilaginibacter sp.]|uniref:hypothetical protein n=1 Tax=Mucilaginibacter sp. TaxID=1882438 RepID=UPI002627BDFE|nr:hypothetical protein [Mucilaginibacter sp.]MDB4922206.1 hypothetical protein [Mucilaginibacter sp.]
MKRITLEVDDETAKAWRSISSALRKQITEAIGELIIQSDKKIKETTLESHLQDAGTVAGTNGLTDEGLAKLLDEEG